LPYWKLLGDDALPDRVVLEAASAFYQSLNQNQKIAFTQQQLFLHGYNIPISGVLDENTTSALENFFQTDTPPNFFDADNFLKIWSTIPVTKNTLKRRQLMEVVLQQQQENQAPPEPQQKPQSHPKQSHGKSEQSDVESKPKAEMQAEPEAAVQDAVDQLLRMLEVKKRKKQESANKQEIDQMLKILEKKK
jgi:hypothetical protein